MKALFISNSSSGMYSFRREVVEAIGKQAETYLCAPKNLETNYWNEIGCKFINYEFDRHGKNPLREFRHISFYKKLLREIRPDIVFTYTIKPNVYAGMACADLGIPYVANITGLGLAIENGGLMQKISLILYNSAYKGHKYEISSQDVFFLSLSQHLNTGRFLFLSLSVLQIQNQLYHVSDMALNDIAQDLPLNQEVNHSYP